MTCLGPQGQQMAAPDFKPQKLTSKAHICTQETIPPLRLNGTLKVI